MDGAGKPVVVTLKLPAVPTVKVVAFALVMAGAWFTVSVKLWGAVDPVLLVAVKVIAYVPPIPAAGVPESVPVPFRLSVKVTPEGKATPPLAMVGAGKPVVVTVKLPSVPTVKVVAFALVIAGAWFTVRVKFWFAFGATPLFAVIVMG